MNTRSRLRLISLTLIAVMMLSVMTTWVYADENVLSDKSEGLPADEAAADETIIVNIEDFIDGEQEQEYVLELTEGTSYIINFDDYVLEADLTITAAKAPEITLNGSSDLSVIGSLTIDAPNSVVYSNITAYYISVVSALEFYNLKLNDIVLSGAVAFYNSGEEAQSSTINIFTKDKVKLGGRISGEVKIWFSEADLELEGKVDNLIVLEDANNANISLTSKAKVALITAYDSVSVTVASGAVLNMITAEADVTVSAGYVRNITVLGKAKITVELGAEVTEMVINAADVTVVADGIIMRITSDWVKGPAFVLSGSSKSAVSVRGSIETKDSESDIEVTVPITELEHVHEYTVEYEQHPLYPQKFRVTIKCGKCGEVFADDIIADSVVESSVLGEGTRYYIAYNADYTVTGDTSVDYMIMSDTSFTYSAQGFELGDYCICGDTVYIGVKRSQSINS